MHRTRGTRFLLSALLALTGCDALSDYTPSWLSGAPVVIKRAPGDRTDVLLNPGALKADREAATTDIVIPEVSNQTLWANRNAAMQVPHLGLTGLTQEDHTRIGEGHDFNRPVAPAPIVAEGLVVVMDAAGIISAHNEAAIGERRWLNRDGVSKDVSDVQGGGLAFHTDTVYAASGDGTVRAVTLATGKTVWSIKVGAPIHGAPAVDSTVVVVLTADNQTIALDRATGATRWSHRGIREAASYFAATAPVISDGIVVAAYTSGEVFALQAETGSVLWSDTLGSTIKTRASAIFSGIDSDPIVQEGVVVATSAAGEMQASLLKNGRPLWQKRIASHATPWSAGSALFILSDTHDIAALLKADGSIRWAQSLAQKDERDSTLDITPPLYGPVLASNAVLVLAGDGQLHAFKPLTGDRINSFRVARHGVTAPVIANGALYIVTRDATLYRYH